MHDSLNAILSITDDEVNKNKTKSKHWLNSDMYNGDVTEFSSTIKSLPENTTIFVIKDSS